MMILISCAVLFVAFPATLGMMTPTQKYPFHKSMNAQGSYQLYWEYDSHMITFEIIANTTGFVGLGWSPKGSMVQADIIVASVSDRDGRLELLDCHGPPGAYNGKPNCTEKSNLIPVASKQQNSYTMIKFRRKLDTCDDPDDRPITDGTMRMIWSMGKTDILEYHGSNRGSRSLRLIGMHPADADLPADYKTFDMVQNKFMMPAVDTHYECVILELPRLKEKHHVIRIDPIIKNPQYVHHIVLYACNLEVNNRTNVSSFLNRSSTCYSRSGGNNQGMGRYDCLIPLFGWGVGGESFKLPKEAGIPIGTDKEPFYARLEIHYNNPRGARNGPDSSGFRLYYTPSLREHDSSAIMMGKLSDEKLLIPPRQSKFMAHANIPKDCTMGKFFFGDHNEVKIFAVFPHSHYAGRAIRVRQVRNGIELPYPFDDQTYDFDYQNMVLLPKEVSIQRGDEFIVECTYNTENRPNATLGGRRTRDEMCLAYLSIYPRIPLSMAISLTNAAQLKNLYMNNRLDGLNQSRSSLESNINWGSDGKLANWWQEVERKQEKYFSVCVTGGYNIKSKNFFNMYPPRIMITSRYTPKPSPCHPITAAAESTNPRNPVFISFAMLVFILVNFV